MPIMILNMMVSPFLQQETSQQQSKSMDMETKD
jgi:hypothetical protein